MTGSTRPRRQHPWFIRGHKPPGTSARIRWRPAGSGQKPPFAMGPNPLIPAASRKVPVSTAAQALVPASKKNPLVVTGGEKQVVAGEGKTQASITTIAPEENR